MEYGWPGNVRELQNAVERAVVMATGPVLRPKHFVLASPRSESLGKDALTVPVGITVAEMEKLGDGISLEEVSRAVKLFSGADFRAMPQSTLPVELALVDYASSGARMSESADVPPATVKAAKPRTSGAGVAEGIAGPRAGVKAAEVAASRDREAETIAEPSASGKGIEVTLPEIEHGPEKTAEVITPGVARGLESSDGPLIAGGAPELEHIRSHWNDFVNACRGEGSTGNLDALLRKACQPMDLKDDTLTLGFYWEFQKGKIEDPKYRHMVEKKLNDVFQAPYKVRCVLLDREKRSKPGGAGESPLVREALKMGAEIVDEERNDG